MQESIVSSERELIIIVNIPPANPDCLLLAVVKNWRLWQECFRIYVLIIARDTTPSTPYCCSRHHAASVLPDTDLNIISQMTSVLATTYLNITRRHHHHHHHQHIIDITLVRVRREPQSMKVDLIVIHESGITFYPMTVDPILIHESGPNPNP